MPEDMPADMPDQWAPGPRRRSRGVPVLAAVAAIGVAIATPMLLGGDDAPAAGARPPNLALLSVGDSTALERHPAGAGAGPGVTYRRTGSWPAAPSSAAVQRPTGPGDVAVVERLARVLRLPTSPVSIGALWTVVSDDGATLRVARTTGAWTYVRDGDASCLPVIVDPAAGPDSVAGCAVPAPRPVRPPAQVSRERAAATADPVLRALGHDPAAARTTPGELAHVDLDPVVAGLPTSGHRTAVAVDERGIRWAHGWLGGVSAGRPTRS
jgi:hypothetical protein